MFSSSFHSVSALEPCHVWMSLLLITAEMLTVAGCYLFRPWLHLTWMNQFFPDLWPSRWSAQLFQTVSMLCLRLPGTYELEDFTCKLLCMLPSPSSLLHHHRFLLQLHPPIPCPSAEG